jgi:Co/Zn/Cd efflux system component
MRDIVLVLMEGNLHLYSIYRTTFFFILGVPSNVNYTKIIDDLLRLPGVRNAHNLHIWSLSLQKTALSVHIAIGRSYCS